MTQRGNVLRKELGAVGLLLTNMEDRSKSVLTMMEDLSEGASPLGRDLASMGTGQCVIGRGSCWKLKTALFLTKVSYKWCFAHGSKQECGGTRVPVAVGLVPTS